MRVWRTIVVGCGGIGGPFAMQASKILTWHKDAQQLMILIDGEKYEARNRERQMVYSPPGANGVDEYKTQNLATLLENLAHPPCELKTMQIFIEHDEHFAGILARNTSLHDDEWTVIALCLDNDATRKMIYDAIPQVKANVLVIDMANEEHDGSVFVYARERRGMYASTHPADVYPQLKKPEDRPPQAYCQEKQPIHPQLLCTNTLAATIGARILWEFLENRKMSQEVTFNLNDFRVRREC